MKGGDVSFILPLLCTTRVMWLLNASYQQK